MPAPLEDRGQAARARRTGEATHTENPENCRKRENPTPEREKLVGRLRVHSKFPTALVGAG